jgi:cytochrome c-type biogenesis protein CcmH
MVWVIAALLLLLAGAVAAWAWMRPPPALSAARAEPEAIVRALYRDRVAELDLEVAAGRLDPEMRREVESELGIALLDDHRIFEQASGLNAPAADRAATGDATGTSHLAALSAGSSTAVAAASGVEDRSRRTGWLLALLLPLAGLGVYAVIGEPTAASVAGAAVVLRLDPETDRAALLDWRERLSRRTTLEPDDAQSWYLLGSIGLTLGEYDAAAEAFATASNITGPDPVIDVYWLQARYLANEGEFDDRTRAIGDRILARNPSHPLVLELYAIDAYRRGAFRDAVTFINRALSNDLEEARTNALLAGLDAARARLEPLLPRIDVAVDAPPDAPRGATLFVIARPPGGGMPFAVVRRPASQMPTAVVLDDTVSMNPDLPLSRAGAFEVVVRLSLSGTPGAHPGDWEWRSEPLDPAALSAPVPLSVMLAPPAAPDPVGPAGSPDPAGTVGPAGALDPAGTRGGQVR